MKFISLFAGVGGFDLALTRLGHECVYTNDIDKYCKIIYEKNFKHKLDCRSIKDVSADEIPAHEILCGGFPCQSFSIAGKRRGFEDTRGTLFFDIARIVRYKRPRLLLLENVKGLLSHDNGFTFKTIISTLTDLGYDLQWQVLNSKDFGVPQNRERVFIVGHIRGTRRPQVFPFQFGNSHTFQGNKQGKNKVADTITTRYAGKNGRGTHVNVGKKFVKKDIANTIDANYYKGMDAHQQRTGVTDGLSIRRLTPTECEKLQGFPVQWTAGVSDTQRYKMMGNAVTVNVVYEIAKHLI